MNFSSLDFSGLRFNADGLIPAIIQEAADDGKPAAAPGADGAPGGAPGPGPAPAGGGGGRVLMMAWMNRAALGATLETGEMHYWSRSRGQLWRKGEQSGHTQRWVGWYADCDGDTLLFVVRQRGGAACHTGHATCFYQARDAAGRPLPVTAEPLFDPAAVYRAAPAAAGAPAAGPAGT